MSRGIAKHVTLNVQKYIMLARSDYKLCQPKVNNIVKWSSNLLDCRTLFQKKLQIWSKLYILKIILESFFLLSSHVLLPYVNMVDPLFKNVDMMLFT